MGDTIWDAQGILWRTDALTSRFVEKVDKDRDARRTASLRLMPWRWSAQLARPSCPVTGLCWFEARAYARWLDSQVALLGAPGWAAMRKNGYEAMLPTELQWERASRASSLTTAHGYRWSWGDDEVQAAQRANIDGSGIRHVCGVGLFPPNAIGLYDMAGNAWQWIDNMFSNSSNFKRLAQGRTLKMHKRDANPDIPAVRGGSWSSRPEDASCSHRVGCPPDDWGTNVGVRVVLSLAD